ncbi:MAG TPA: IS21 family transposase [Pyrinomonadaceae bacterium]
MQRTERTMASAAAKAGMDQKTARKYRRLGKPPSQCKKARTWRTRVNIFQEVWPEVEQLLEQDQSVEAVTIMGHLCRKYGGRFKPSQVRTLQRRIKQWRASAGAPREVFFPQQHKPGRQAQSDFTYMNELKVTIAGQPFEHLFYHFVLTYSNWETGTICFSESFEALAGGLQNALWELGSVPEEHRTDSLSAAVNKLRNRDEFTARYQGLLRHYGMRASHTNAGQAHENGDVEQSHYRFKKAVAQELILRGSRDFASREEYEKFLEQLLKRRNKDRQEQLKEEVLKMRALPARRMEDYRTEHMKVSRNSTLMVRNNIYSVPSQLVGERVEVRVFADYLEVWYGGKRIQSMERLRGTGQQSINYRHVIHSLIRKPGAFVHYRYQPSLFPRVMFRVAYDCLCERYPRTAVKQYLKILHLAANAGEEKVHTAIQRLLDDGQAVSIRRVEKLVATQEWTPRSAWEVSVHEVDLTSYDELLRELDQEVAA